MHLLGKSRALLAAGVVGLALMVGGSPAQAAKIDICSKLGLEGQGAFEGYLDYDSTLFKLTVSLKNTSPSAGGKLVAFLFNNPGNKITGVSVSTSTFLSTLLGKTTFNNTIKAAPLSNFDIGVSLGGNNNNGFEGAGGSPANGLAIGSTGTWTFTFTGTGLGALTTQDFVNTKTDGEFLYVRFKGFNNGKSDKVGAEVCPPPPAPVPEPAFYQMSALLGFGGLGALRLRRSRRSQ